MANYAGSLLVTGQAKLFGAFQTAELRYRRPATFEAFLKSSNIMFPDFNVLKTRDDRTVEASYTKRTSRALGSARSHNHTGAHGDSAILTPSWATKADVFAMSLKQADKNLYSIQEMFNNELFNTIANFAEGLETASASFLFAGRSGANLSTVEGTYDATDKVFKVTESTNGARFAQIIKSNMDINKYSGQLDVFCDTVAFNKFVYQMAQGQANSTNLTFQFGGLNFIHCPDFNASFAGLVGAYVKGSVIAVPVGTYGVLPWIPKQNREGVDTSVNKYSTIQNPVDGLSYGVHTYETRVDGTSVGGYTQDVSTEFQISLDVAFVQAPLSTSSTTTFQAFSLV